MPCCWPCSEEALYELLAAVEPNIVDMRVIKDKYTGAPTTAASLRCTHICAVPVMHADYDVAAVDGWALNTDEL
jgi:hypothetical protein